MQISKKIGKIVKGILLLIAAIITIGLFIGGVYFAKGYNMYKSTLKDKPFTETINQIKNKDNYTAFEDIPEFYINALIAVEDHRFESHNGLDFIAIARALLTDIKHMKLVEGGSTITQQLAKNTFYSQEKKLERKFAEIFMAYKIEKEYAKEEILELYINSIYYGDGYYSLYEASQGYLNKNPSELTDVECLMIVGLPNAPSLYSPNVSPNLTIKRAEQVIEAMNKYQKIENKEALRLIQEINDLVAKYK